MVEGVVFRDGVRTDERVAIDGVPPLAKQAGVFIWIDVEEPTEDTLEALAGEFRLHPLVGKTPATGDNDRRWSCSATTCSWCCERPPSTTAIAA
jgi:Mg2+ and Co2+ transporter CorA